MTLFCETNMHHQRGNTSPEVMHRETNTLGTAYLRQRTESILELDVEDGRVHGRLLWPLVADGRGTVVPRFLCRLVTLAPAH